MSVVDTPDNKLLCEPCLASAAMQRPQTAAREPGARLAEAVLDPYRQIADLLPAA